MTEEPAKKRRRGKNTPPNPTPGRRTIVHSYGGGIQSVALCVLIKEGNVPRPDLILIVDTSRECQSTWDYMDGVMIPYLAPSGLTITRVPHSFARKDLYDDSGLTLVPAYTDEGKLSTFCSGEWKRDAAERYMRSVGIDECDIYIGFSIDEMERVTKKDHRPWCHYQYPLIDRMVNRRMCMALIEGAGLPLPRKSRCWCCPYQNDEEWSQVYANHDEWRKAVNLDEEIRVNDPEQRGLYLHTSRKPLRLVTPGKQDGVVTPAKTCDTGFCWT